MPSAAIEQAKHCPSDVRISDAKSSAIVSAEQSFFGRACTRRQIFFLLAPLARSLCCTLCSRSLLPDGTHEEKASAYCSEECGKHLFRHSRMLNPAFSAHHVFTRCRRGRTSAPRSAASKRRNVLLARGPAVARHRVHCGRGPPLRGGASLLMALCSLPSSLSFVLRFPLSSHHSFTRTSH